MLLSLAVAASSSVPSSSWLAPVITILCVCLTAVFALVAWIVKSLLTTATTNATATEQLANLDARMERVERALFAPAWDQQRERGRNQWKDEQHE